MRVIAVSAETSLAAALNMMDGWEVVFAHDPEQIPTIADGASVLLAGGGTEQGLELIASLRRIGLDLPAIVLGDRPPPEDAESTVLTPPFTLDELRSAVENALRVRVAPPVAPAQTSSADASEDVARSDVTDADDGRLLGLAADDRSTGGPPKDLISGLDGEDGEPGSLAAGVVEPASPPHEPAASEAVPGSAPVAPLVVPDDRPVEPVAPVVAVPEPVAPEPVAPTPLPLPIPSQPPEERSRRRRKRRDRDDEVPSAPVRLDDGQPIPARLRAAEDAARAIEAVLDDMPFLADIEVLAGALIGEVVEAFKPQIAVLYLPGTDGAYWVAGGHEITNAERRLKVKRDHPLFRELFAAREPMLIAPLDLARALVSGVAGARTEALIASPVYSGANCVGVIVVGRDDFSDPDLDTLARLCAEAAPGLGVAEALDRLRSFRP